MHVVQPQHRCSPNFYCAYYLLLQGVEEQPATRRNLSSQARIFSRHLGPNSELFSLLACPFTSQHLPTSFPAQETKLFIKKKKNWLLTLLPSKSSKHQYLLLEKQSCKACKSSVAIEAHIFLSCKLSININFFR